MKRKIGGLWARKIALGTVSAVLLGALVAGPTAAGSAMSFRVYMGDGCLAIYSDGSVDLHLVWRDMQTNVKVNTTFPAEDYGLTYYCSPTEIVEAGDQIKVNDGTSDHVLVVPDLTININRVIDALKGHGPAGGVVRLRCSGGPFPMFEPCVWKDRVRVNGEGRWSRGLPFEVLGGAVYHALWVSPARDKVWATGTAPFLNMTLGKSRFTGAFRNNGVVGVIIRDSATLEIKATGGGNVSPLSGDFVWQLEDTHGDPYLLLPGDLVSSNIASDAEWIVPDIDLSVTLATDVVSGHCTGPDPTLVEVFVKKNSLHGPAIWGLEPDGAFTFDFNEESWGNANITSGDKVLVKCMRAQGDWVQKTFIAN